MNREVLDSVEFDYLNKKIEYLENRIKTMKSTLKTSDSLTQAMLFKGFYGEFQTAIKDYSEFLSLGKDVSSLQKQYESLRKLVSEYSNDLNSLIKETDNTYAMAVMNSFEKIKDIESSLEETKIITKKIVEKEKEEKEEKEKIATMDNWDLFIAHKVLKDRAWSLKYLGKDIKISDIQNIYRGGDSSFYKDYEIIANGFKLYGLEKYILLTLLKEYYPLLTFSANINNLITIGGYNADIFRLEISYPYANRTNLIYGFGQIGFNSVNRNEAGANLDPNDFDNLNIFTVLKYAETQNKQLGSVYTLLKTAIFNLYQMGILYCREYTITYKSGISAEKTAFLLTPNSQEDSYKISDQPLNNSNDKQHYQKVVNRDQQIGLLKLKYPPTMVIYESKDNIDESLVKLPIISKSFGLNLYKSKIQAEKEKEKERKKKEKAKQPKKKTEKKPKEKFPTQLIPQPTTSVKTANIFDVEEFMVLGDAISYYDAIKGSVEEIEIKDIEFISFRKNTDTIIKEYNSYIDAVSSFTKDVLDKSEDVNIVYVLLKVKNIGEIFGHFEHPNQSSEYISEEKHSESLKSEKKPTEKKPTEKKPTEKKPTEKKPTEKKPTEKKPTEKKRKSRSPMTAKAKEERRREELRKKISKNLNLKN